MKPNIFWTCFGVWDITNLWIVASPPYKYVVRKMATVEGRLFRLDVDKEYHCRGIFSG